MGGGELARDFLRLILVDELYIGIVPVLLGEGIPLFPSGFPQRNFSLIENKTYSRGLIALKYKRAPSEPSANLDCSLSGQILAVMAEGFKVFRRESEYESFSFHLFFFKKVYFCFF